MNKKDEGIDPMWMKAILAFIVLALVIVALAAIAGFYYLIYKAFVWFICLYFLPFTKVGDACGIEGVMALLIYILINLAVFVGECIGAFKRDATIMIAVGSYFALWIFTIGTWIL